MAAPIIGATTSTQLQHILEGVDTTLSDELRSGIAAIYKKYPRPM
jgi:aryl-alcohol dehydrogenase-like predicted oxidoreductase